MHKFSFFFLSRMSMNESVKLDIQQCSNITLEKNLTEPTTEEIAVEKDKERKLLRKLDLRIVPWVLVLYFLSMEDRGNVGFAMTMNSSEHHTLQDTSGLTSQQNNIGLGLFYVAYIVNKKNIQKIMLTKRVSRYLKYRPTYSWPM